MTLAAAREQLGGAGFNLCGELAAGEYDALVPPAWKLAALAPRARGVLIVGHAGRALWPHFSASPEARLERDPLDRYTRRVVSDAARELGPDTGWALYSEQREGSCVPLVALARRAGLGTPGRVGVLLHPVYGPWISLRALLFTPEALAAPAADGFDPCSGCPAPCASACHGHAIGERAFDSPRCYATRVSLDACALRCDARLACPVGSEHAYPAEQRAHHYRISNRRARTRMDWQG
jgi:hypothetical protein